MYWYFKKHRLLRVKQSVLWKAYKPKQLQFRRHSLLTEIRLKINILFIKIQVTRLVLQILLIPPVMELRVIFLSGICTWLFLTSGAIRFMSITTRLAEQTIQEIGRAGTEKPVWGLTHNQVFIIIGMKPPPGGFSKLLIKQLHHLRKYMVRDMFIFSGDAHGELIPNAIYCFTTWTTVFFFYFRTYYSVTIPFYYHTFTFGAIGVHGIGFSYMPINEFTACFQGNIFCPVQLIGGCRR